MTAYCLERLYKPFSTCTNIFLYADILHLSLSVSNFKHNTYTLKYVITLDSPSHACTMDSQDRTSLLVNNKICTVHSGLQSLSLTGQNLSSMVAPIFHIRLMDCYILHMEVSKVVEAFQDLISLLCSKVYNPDDKTKY